MSMNRTQKEKEVEFLTEQFKRCKAAVLADYRGLKVGQITELRSKVYQGNAKMKVVKNRLAKIALKNASIEGLDGFFLGPTAMVWSTDDEVAPAKIFVEFAKGNAKLEVKGGYLDGRSVDLTYVKWLAALPSREIMLAQILGSMSAPATNFVGVLSALPRQLVTVLNAIKEKKEN